MTSQRRRMAICVLWSLSLCMCMGCSVVYLNIVDIAYRVVDSNSGMPMSGAAGDWFLPENAAFPEKPDRDGLCGKPERVAATDAKGLGRLTVKRYGPRRPKRVWDASRNGLPKQWPNDLYGAKARFDFNTGRSGDSCIGNLEPGSHLKGEHHEVEILSVDMRWPS